MRREESIINHSFFSRIIDIIFWIPNTKFDLGESHAI